MKRSSLVCLGFLIVLLVVQFSVFRFAYATTSTFGYSSGTGSAQYTIGTGSGTTDKITGSVFTITEDGTADSITVSLKRYSSNGNEKGKCSIYLHSDLSLVGNTTEATKALTTTLAWYTFTFSDPKPSLIANTAYVLVVWVDTTTYVYLGANSGNANQGHYQTVTYDGFPNPYVPTHVTYAFSIYCTYTIRGADVTNPTHSNVGTNTTQAGEPCQFQTLWNDNVNMSGHIFGTNNTGSWVNDTWTAFPVFYNTTAAWSNVTKTLTSTLGATVQWQIWANDTSNNWDTTGIQSLVAVSTFVQTRYFRYDLDTVNSLLARKLLTVNTDSSTSETHGKAGNVVSAGATIGILVWNVSAAGATEITSGDRVAEVTVNTTYYGSMVSATWDCPLTLLTSTDSIIVIVYGRFGTDAWAQFGSFAFSTEQLGAESLDAATWTVYYGIELWYSSPNNITWHVFDFDSSSWNSRITNFVLTKATGKEYSLYGSASLTFVLDIQRTIQFNRYGGATLTFTTVGICWSGVFLNLFGSALLTFASMTTKAFEFCRYGTSALTFSTAYEKLVSFGWFGSSSLTFLVESFQNFVSVKTLSLFGSANLNFITDILRRITLNRYGTSTLTFASNIEKVMSFVRYGMSGLTFVAESLRSLTRTLTFGGSANLSFLSEQLRTFTFNRYGTAPLTFTVEGIAQGLGRLLTFFGSATFCFTIFGEPVGLEVIDLISLALSILALAFSAYPLVAGEEKALPAIALVMAIVGCALSVLGLWYALPIAALSFVLGIAALATRKEPEKD